MYVVFHIIRNIRVQCFDWNKNGSHSLIGEFTTSMRKLTTGSGAQNVYDVSFLKIITVPPLTMAVCIYDTFEENL